jgi:hypothetical protein
MKHEYAVRPHVMKKVRSAADSTISAGKKVHKPATMYISQSTYAKSKM